MAKLPKSIIKKYGITKKAWSVFRGQKTTRKIKTRSRGVYMAKRKYKNSTKNKGGFINKAMNIAIGAGIAALYEVFVSPMIPLSRNIKNIIELVIGVIVAVMPKLPMWARAGGAALATINAFEIFVPLISGAKKTAVLGGNLAGFLQN